MCQPLSSQSKHNLRKGRSGPWHRLEAALCQRTKLLQPMVTCFTGASLDQLLRVE